MEDYRAMTTKEDIVRCYAEDLITEKEFLSAIKQLKEFYTNQHETARQQMVADNLVKRITPMFYGGNLPSTDEIFDIVSAFTATVEWKLSPKNAVLVTLRISDQLAK